MKRKIILFFCAAALLPLAGCTLTEDDYESGLMQPEDEESAETTTGSTFDLDSFTATLTQPHWSYDNDSRYESPEETETTTAPAEETTAATAETTVQTTTEATSAEPTSTEPAEPAEPTTIPAQYRLSALPSAKLTCTESASRFLNDANVLDLSAAAAANGFRADGGVYTLTRDGITVSVQAGTLLSDADEPTLQTIRYTFGGQAVTATVDQRAPARANYALPDGTRITADQAVLFVFLCEQLAAAPEEDPLLHIVPVAYRETVGNETFYYLP